MIRGDYYRSLIITSQNAEQALWLTLHFNNIKPGKLTLNHLIKQCRKKELISETKARLLRRFAELRNLAIHHRTTLMKIIKDKKMKTNLRRAIASALNVVDLLGIPYDNNPKLMDGYDKFERSVENRLQKIMSAFK